MQFIGVKDAAVELFAKMLTEKKHYKYIQKLVVTFENPS